METFADEFIARLPEVYVFRALQTRYYCRSNINTSRGFATQDGDSGSKLSGGQRQRLAITRCIVKETEDINYLRGC